MCMQPPLHAAAWTWTETMCGRVNASSPSHRTILSAPRFGVTQAKRHKTSSGFTKRLSCSKKSFGKYLKEFQKDTLAFTSKPSAARLPSNTKDFIVVSRTGLQFDALPVRIVPLNPHTRSHLTYVARTIASLLHSRRLGCAAGPRTPQQALTRSPTGRRLRRH